MLGEKRIGARHILPEQLNGNGAKLQQGSEKLGYRGYLPLHNRTDCLGCGYCALGCTYDRKGDMLTTYVPAASRAGALIVPDCQVTQVVTQNARAATLIVSVFAPLLSASSAPSVRGVTVHSAGLAKEKRPSGSW